MQGILALKVELNSRIPCDRCPKFECWWCMVLRDWRTFHTWLNEIHSCIASKMGDPLGVAAAIRPNDLHKYFYCAYDSLEKITGWHKYYARSPQLIRCFPVLGTGPGMQSISRIWLRDFDSKFHSHLKFAHWFDQRFGCCVHLPRCSGWVRP